MQFKLSEEKQISLEEIKENCELDIDKTYYLMSNTKKDGLKKITQVAQKANKNAYIKKIKFTLENEDFLYSVHIV